MVVIDRIWAQVRKVRRRRITEALLDPLGSPFEPAPASPPAVPMTNDEAPMTKQI
jgi:hypothetical protein